MNLYEEIISDLLSLKTDFRINDLDETLEIKTKTGWRHMNETHEDIIKLEMQEKGYGGHKNIALSTVDRAITKRANHNRYNPIKDYFDGLPEYETRQGEYGIQPYKILEFSEYFTNPDGYFGLWLFKWMVGAIAKIVEGERNPMLVLASPQYAGKSSLCEWLCPMKDRFIRGAINPDSKDHKLRLNVVFIWEVEELEATTRRQDVASLKSFITLPSTYERPAYKKHPVHKTSMASFIGTINPDGAGFLNDTTGSTRFLVCELDAIDWQGYTANANVDDLWSEAYWFYQNMPDSWKLSPEQDAARIKINAKFEVVSALEDAILAKFEITTDQETIVTTQEIKSAIYDVYRITNEQAFYNELGRVCNKLGVKRAPRQMLNGKYLRGWKGLKMRLEETEAAPF